MNRPSKNDDAPESQQSDFNIPLEVQPPVSQLAFPVTERQWDYLRRQIGEVGVSENVWFSTSLAFLAFSVSFFINILLPGAVQFWVETVLWTGTGAGLVGAVVCFVAYRTNRSQRESDIQAVLTYMDEIRQAHRE